jgi:hypothetical protein
VLDIEGRGVALLSSGVALVSRTCERAAQGVDPEDGTEGRPWAEEKRSRARCSGEAPREKRDDQGNTALSPRDVRVIEAVKRERSLLGASHADEVHRLRGPAHQPCTVRRAVAVDAADVRARSRARVARAAPALGVGAAILAKVRACGIGRGVVREQVFVARCRGERARVKAGGALRAKGPVGELWRQSIELPTTPVA